MVTGVLLWVDTEWASIFSSRVKRDKKVFVGPDKDPFVVHGVIPNTDEHEIAECVLTLVRAKATGDRTGTDWCIERLAVLTGIGVL